MKEIHCFYVPDAATALELPEEEARHALRVLRLGVGQRIMITDGCGSIYDAEVVGTSGRTLSYEIIGREEQKPLWNGHLHIAVAPTKNIDRTEWFVEKAVEIGIDEISFLRCRFSERTVVKRERIERVAIAAMKQSRKAVLPRINDVADFGDFLKRTDIEGEKYIAHCLSDDVAAEAGQSASASARCWLPAVMGEGSKTVVIGPEGDFAPDEVEAAISAGYVPVSLGESRLRTETAALYAATLINLKNSRLAAALLKK